MQMLRRRRRRRSLRARLDWINFNFRISFVVFGQRICPAYVCLLPFAVRLLPGLSPWLCTTRGVYSMQQLLLATARPDPARPVSMSSKITQLLKHAFPIHMPPFTYVYVHVHVRTYVRMYACTYVHAPTGFHPHSRTLCVCTGTFRAFASVWDWVSDMDSIFCMSVWPEEIKQCLHQRQRDPSHPISYRSSWIYYLC